MKNIQLASSLRNVISKMNKRLRKKMNATGSLSISETTTLSYLYQTDSLSPSELAGLIMVKTQSMSELLVHLKQLNIIDKTPSLTDKRKFAVSLTRYGRQIVEETRYERDEWLMNAIEHHLSEREKAVLKEAVELMDKLCDFE